MTYKLPYAKRMRISARRKERYSTEPEYRLARINERRLRDGAPPRATLDEVGLQRDPATRQRDDRGRFAPDAR